MHAPTPPEGSAQRLAGFSHAELYRMAHGGDPESAGQAGLRLSRVAETLRGVSNGLERAAASVGVGWTGQASQAARGGIGDHAAWAREAGQQAARAGTAAAEQAASARNVIAQMPPPAAAPRGGSPLAVDLAQVEQAQENARLRAVELMRGHAEASARARPAGTFTSLAGSPGNGPTSTSAGRGAAAGRGTAAGGAPERVPGPTTGRAVSSGGPGVVSRPNAAPTTSRTGAAGSGAAGAGRPTAGARSAMPGPARRGLDLVTASGSGAGPARTIRRSGPATDGPVAAVGEAAGRGPRPIRPGDGTHRTRQPVRGEHLSARGGEQPFPDRRPEITRQQGASGGQEPRGPGSGGLTPGLPGGMAPPMAGTAGGGAWRPEHERLGYLLDDESLFDGESLFDDEDPMTPPVLGGRPPRPSPSNPWETR